MQRPKTRWKIQEQATSEIDALVNELQLAPLVAKLLLNRGIDTVEKAKRFLYREEMDYHDPFLLDGMEALVQRVKKAVEAEEKILVFGDYDADGVSSTALLYSVLRTLGAEVDYYIPNRFTEGYGPNEPALRQAQAEGVRLVITVDTGIAAVDVAEVAKEIGIDFIITDHHEAPPVLPDAYAIINPKKPGCPYPFKGLAGVGVAFKVAQALLGRVPTEWLDFVVIGTIADLVPLVDENRLLVIEGLRALQVTDRPGLISLKKMCGLEAQVIKADHVGFGIGPRINASGRLDSADPAVELLLTNDVDEAEHLAELIDGLNKERQTIVNELTAEAVAIVEREYPLEENDVLVVAGEGWNSGVIGIVASRLVERYYRPTIVLSIDAEKGLAKGSARSITGFDMFQELSKNRNLLPHFGGHPMAAGLTMDVANIETLRARLNEQARAVLTEDDFKPLIDVDLIVQLEDISVDVIKQLERIAPFGMANPAPKVLVQDVHLEQMRKIGKDEQHLKLSFMEDGMTLDGIGFHLGYLYEEITPQAAVSALGSLSLNEWNGHVKPQLMIEDMGVFEWQLFDWRSLKKESLHKEIEKLPVEERVVISFRQETKEALGLKHIHVQISDKISVPIDDRYVILLDVPRERGQITQLFANGERPSRIYTVFYQETDAFFTTNPSREQFKWFYAFLVKRKQFDLRKFGPELAKYKGWSKDTVHFMAKVFYELGFITVNGGMITVVDKPEKKQLEQSPTFRYKQEQALIENELVYSAYYELRQWFAKLLSHSKKEDEFMIKGMV